MADDSKTQPQAPTAASPAAAKGATNIPSIKTSRGTVAKGRTVLAPTEERRIVGYGEGGDPVYRAVDKRFGPGQEVTLPEEEILHLRRTGFLVDPNAAVANYGNGPDYGKV